MDHGVFATSNPPLSVYFCYAVYVHYTKMVTLCTSLKRTQFSCDLDTELSILLFLSNALRLCLTPTGLAKDETYTVQTWLCQWILVMWHWH